MANQRTLDDYDLGKIAQAKSFRISLFMGHGAHRGAWVKDEAPTLADAIARAATMDKELGPESGGRRAMIFAVVAPRKASADRNAVTPKDEYFVAPALYPTLVPTKETQDMMTTIETATTYSNRQNCIRAVKKAGYDKDSARIFQTSAGRWAFCPLASQPQAPEPNPADDAPHGYAGNGIGEETAERIPANPVLDEMTEASRHALPAYIADEEHAPPSPPAFVPLKDFVKPATRIHAKTREAFEAAARGELPEPPDFSANTHKPFRSKLAKLTELAEAGDIEGLKAVEIKPTSSSPKALDRYRNLCVTALEARANQAE